MFDATRTADGECLVPLTLQVVVANPKTAGVARWIFLALWGSQTQRDKKGAMCGSLGSWVWPKGVACEQGEQDGR